MRMLIECSIIGFPQDYPVEIWARAASNVAEKVSAVTRINNDILFRNIDAFGTAFERAQRHTEELSRINVNKAKIIANSASDTAFNTFCQWMIIKLNC
jgi:hypothetical protein